MIKYIPGMSRVATSGSSSFITESKVMNVMKGLGIIAVVVGHSGFPMAFFLYLFHMQLFFFISGYFFKDKYVNTPIQFLWRRVKSLYLPFIAAEMIFLTARTLVTPHDFAYIDVIKALTFNSASPHLYALWFLVVLFFVNVLFIAISVVVKRYFGSSEKIRALLVCTIAAIGFSMILSGINIFTIFNSDANPVKNLFLNLIDTRVLICLPLFYIGYIYHAHGSRIPIRGDLTLASFAVLLLSYFSGRVDILHNVIMSPTYFIFNALLGIYLCMYLANVITNGRLANAISYIGKKSLYIMILHVAAFSIVKRLLLINYDDPTRTPSEYISYQMQHTWWLWIAYAICGLVVPLLACYLAVRAKVYARRFTRSVTSLRSKLSAPALKE